MNNKIHRCVICNCVSVPDIATDLGDYKSKMSFMPDPSNDLSDICVECYEVIAEVESEYEWEEYETNG